MARYCTSVLSVLSHTASSKGISWHSATTKLGDQHCSIWIPGLALDCSIWHWHNTAVACVTLPSACWHREHFEVMFLHTFACISCLSYPYYLLSLQKIISSSRTCGSFPPAWQQVLSLWNSNKFVLWQFCVFLVSDLLKAQSSTCDSASSVVAGAVIVQTLYSCRYNSA